MNILIVGIVIFVMSVFIIELSFYAYRTIRNPNRGRIRKRLKRFAAEGDGAEPADILRKRRLSNIPFLNEILLHTPGVQSLGRLLQQANVHCSIGVFILIAVIMLLTGYVGASIMTKSSAVSVITAGALSATPFFYLRFKKKKRMENFQSQLPEALEMISHALKAGHAFTSGMKMAADEFSDPLGHEFDKTLDEVNFGISITEALKNLAERVDCPDLKYFVVSVILQRETGGNLSEIIESISHIIRERFKLRGKVRVLSAEGKLSAAILVAIPILVVIALSFTNPAYLSSLLDESAGKMMVGMAVSMMTIGVFVIKKMINIKI